MFLFGLLTVFLGASTTTANGNFIGEGNAKMLSHQFNWQVTVYRLNKSQQKKIYEEVLEVPVMQEDGSYLSCSDKVTVFEQEANDNTSLITLSLKDIDVDGKPYSETFTFEDKGHRYLYIKKNEAGNIRVSMTRLVKESKNNWLLY